MHVYDNDMTINYYYYVVIKRYLIVYNCFKYDKKKFGGFYIQLIINKKIARCVII